MRLAPLTRLNYVFRYPGNVAITICQREVGGPGWVCPYPHTVGARARYIPLNSLAPGHRSRKSSGGPGIVVMVSSFIIMHPSGTNATRKRRQHSSGGTREGAGKRKNSRLLALCSCAERCRG